MSRVVTAAALLIGAATVHGQVPVRQSGNVDRPLAWRATEVWQVPGARAEMLLTRLGPTDVAAHPDGRVFVLDRVGMKVYVLSAQGVLTDSLGRRGRGPAELSHPASLTLDADRNLAVFDRSKGAFVRWSANGEPLDETGVGTFVFGPGVAFVRDGFVFRHLLRTGEQASRYQLVVASGAGRTVLATGPSFEAVRASFPSCGASDITTPRLFVHTLPWAASHGRLVVSDDVEYAVTVFDDTGESIVRIVRDIPPTRVTARMARTELTDWRVNDCVVDPEEALRAIGHHEFRPAIARVQIAPGGDVWVGRRGARGTVSSIDVFSAGGEYRGTLPSGFPFPDAFASDSRFVTVSVDGMDVPVVTLYEIERS